MVSTVKKGGWDSNTTAICQNSDVRTDCAPFIIMQKILLCFLVGLVQIPLIQGIL